MPVGKSMPSPSFHSYVSPPVRWLPVMRAYESGSAAYFATPPVNLLYAYHASLQQILRGPVSLVDRLAAHIAASARIRDVVRELGMRCVPLKDEISAHGMTAVSDPVSMSRDAWCWRCALRADLPFPIGVLPTRTGRLRHYPPSLCERCCHRGGSACSHQERVFPNRVGWFVHAYLDTYADSMTDIWVRLLLAQSEETSTRWSTHSRRPLQRRGRPGRDGIGCRLQMSCKSDMSSWVFILDTYVAS